MVLPGGASDSSYASVCARGHWARAHERLIDHVRVGTSQETAYCILSPMSYQCKRRLLQLHEGCCNILVQESAAENGLRSEVVTQPGN